MARECWVAQGPCAALRRAPARFLRRGAVVDSGGSITHLEDRSRIMMFHDMCVAGGGRACNTAACSPDAVAPHACSPRFYTRLFDLVPHTRRLFKAGLKHQGKALVKMFTLAVGALGTDDFAPLVRSLGRRHAAYHVHPRYFEPLGKGMLDAFAYALPREVWTPAAREAWITWYSILCREMIPELCKARAKRHARRQSTTQVAPAAADSAPESAAVSRNNSMLL